MKRVLIAAADFKELEGIDSNLSITVWSAMMALAVADVEMTSVARTVVGA